MTEPNVVTTTLEAYADGATAPADLLDRVERRYRRRRNRRAVGAGAAVLVLVAAVVGGVALNPFGSHAPAKQSHPTQVAAGLPNTFDPIVPKTPSKLPTIPKVWPNSSFQLPAKAPDGGKTWPMEALDQSHVLILSQPAFEAAGALYSFDTANGTFTSLVSQLTTKYPAYLNRFAVSPHWLIWEIDGKNSMDVYKAPRAGGEPQLVAHVAVDSGATGPWTATDQAVYWSPPNGTGVQRLALTGGAPQALPGFAKFQLVDGSTSAMRATKPANSPGSVTHEIKNVVSGADFPVTPLPGAAMLTCAPPICVGWTDAGVGWVQNLSGTQHKALPSVLRGGSLCNCGAPDGVYIVQNMARGFVLWTPADGKIGEGTSPSSPKGSSTFGWFGMQVLGWQTVAGGRISEYVAVGSVR